MLLTLAMVEVKSVSRVWCPQKKYAARRGSVWNGMRMITACFARVLQRCTSRRYMRFLLTSQKVRTISKTRNRLGHIRPWNPI